MLSAINRNTVRLQSEHVSAFVGIRITIADIAPIVRENIAREANLMTDEATLH